MSDTSKKVLVLGTPKNAAVLMDVFEDSPEFSFVGVVSNQSPGAIDQEDFGLPIFWSDDIGHLVKDHFLTCSLGTTFRKTWILDRIASGFQFVRLFHHSSVVSQRTSFGAGAIVDAGVVVAGYCAIADHVRIGRQASIGHHITIGEFSTIHPGAIISGNCDIGKQVTVGSGAIIIPGIKVGDGAFVAAGAVVVDDIPANALVGGNPAKVLRKEYGPR